MHSRRLDDRIRDLCAQVAAASKTDLSSGELDGILQDLLCAVHEKIERLRSLAAKHLISREPIAERRAAPFPDGKTQLKS
jgi:RNA processing factor Prp31